MTTAATATDRGALAQSLRALKLSGMLDTLDARLTQARAGELGHLDFLQVLCHDEISRRETLSLARRLRHARFEQQATLEGFDFGASPKLPAAQIRDLAALRWLQAGDSVILYARLSPGFTIVIQRCWPTWPRRWTSSREGGWSLASAQGGTRKSPAPMASLWVIPVCAATGSRRRARSS